MARPLTSEIELVYNELFNSSTLDNLITSALYGRLFHGKCDQENVVGRSMMWKLFLCPQPPLTNNLTPNPTPPLAFLRDIRTHHMASLRSAGLSHYNDDADMSSSSRPATSTTSSPNDWSLNNPLSLDSSNPWHAYFSAAETRKLIKQDVDRAFPEIPYFRQPEVQNALTNILFVYTKGNGDIGYRQGMHELLACIYKVVDYDSVGDECSNPQLQEFCSSSYIAADAHALFELVMKYMEAWYEWQPSQTMFSQDLTPDPYVPPVIKACISLRDEKLRSVDPFLWEKLREGGIEPQIYAMRWLRLLFTREFTFSESMILWDGLFASVIVEDIPLSSISLPKNGFAFALWIGVAMLMRIRNFLITGNYTDQLTNVVRYPSLRTVQDAKSSNVPSLLLMQARSLMSYPNPSTGVSIMMQNRSELGIAAQPREPSSPRQTHRLPSAAFSLKSHSPVSNLSGTSLPTRIHRILDSNNSVGIQRSFQNTFGVISDLKKNLPDISHALSLNSSWNPSSISLHDNRSNDSISERSPKISGKEGRTIQERRIMSSERAELGGLLKTLGGAMEWALNTLLSDSETSQEAIQGRKIKAFQCLEHVKDILIDEGKADVDIQLLLDPALRSHPLSLQSIPKETSSPSFTAKPQARRASSFSHPPAASQLCLENQASRNIGPSDPLGVS